MEINFEEEVVEETKNKNNVEVKDMSIQEKKLRINKLEQQINILTEELRELLLDTKNLHTKTGFYHCEQLKAPKCRGYARPNGEYNPPNKYYVNKKLCAACKYQIKKEKCGKN